MPRRSPVSATRKAAVSAAISNTAASRSPCAFTTYAKYSAGLNATSDTTAALAPRRLATAFAQQYDLKLFEPPYRSPVIDIEALWRRDLGASAAIDWLRSRLRAAAARL